MGQSPTDPQARSFQLHAGQLLQMKSSTVLLKKVGGGHTKQKACPGEASSAPGKTVFPVQVIFAALLLTREMCGWVEIEKANSEDG